MSGINYEVTMSIKDIFQSGRDVVCKMKGGLLVVGSYGERIVSANNISEIPPRTTTFPTNRVRRHIPSGLVYMDREPGSK